MARFGSQYLIDRFCSWCGEKRGLYELRCHVCHHMTRGSNVRSGSRFKQRISGITGREAIHA